MATSSLVKVILITLFILLFALPSQAHAQSEADCAGSINTVVKAVNGHLAECAGGITLDLSTAQIFSIFGEKSVADVEPGARLRAEGEVVKGQGAPGSPLFKVTQASIFLSKEVLVCAPVQSVDTVNNTITIFNQKVQIDANTLLLREKKNKKPKTITLAEIMPGQEVTIEANLIDGRLLALTVVRGISPENIDARIIAFTTLFDGRNLTLAGGFVADVSKFLAVANEIAVGIPVAIAIANPLGGENPLQVLSLGVTNKNLFIGGRLFGVDTAAGSVTLLDKTIKVGPETKFSGVAKSLEALKLGEFIGVQFIEAEAGLLAVDISQAFRVP